MNPRPTTWSSTRGRATTFCATRSPNLETRLPPRLFVRISRSVIVNLDSVKELQPGLQGDHVVVLHGNKQLTMTRGLREVQERLQYS